jgi:hypothetical protein
VKDDRGTDKNSISEEKFKLVTETFLGLYPDNTL